MQPFPFIVSIIFASIVMLVHIVTAKELFTNIVELSCKVVVYWENLSNYDPFTYEWVNVMKCSVIFFLFFYDMKWKKWPPEGPSPWAIVISASQYYATLVM